MITLWQGSANTWDCDEMGHMNVRIYIEKALEGLGRFAQHIEMPHAFQAGTRSTLAVVDHHIRYIREVHPGRPLSMRGCVLEVGDTDVRLYQEIQHGDGTVAAAFRSHIQHIEVKSGQPFAWSQTTRATLEALKDTPPDTTAPRSIPDQGATLPKDEISREIARAHGAPRIGVGMVPPHHCDPHGRMRVDWFMGRISDSVPNLLYDWRRKVAESANNASMGAAVLEYRFRYRDLPQAGDTFEIYGSLARIKEKTHGLVYWIVDPMSGKPWATAEAVAVTFDLTTRKIIPTRTDHMAELERLAPRGLAL